MAACLARSLFLLAQANARKEQASVPGNDARPPRRAALTQQVRQVAEMEKLLLATGEQACKYTEPWQALGGLLPKALAALHEDTGREPGAGGGGGEQSAAGPARSRTSDN